MKERPWHRCFHLNFAKFLRTLFLQSTFWRQLIGFFINVRRWFSYDISNSPNNFPESQKNHLAFMCMAILRWAAPWLQFTFLGSCVCIGSRKIPPGKFPPGKFPPIKLPPWKVSPRKILTHQTPPLENFSPENSHPENFHLEYPHLFHYLSFFT